MARRKQAVKGQIKKTSNHRYREQLIILLKSAGLRKVLLLVVVFSLAFTGYKQVTRNDVLVIETVQIEGEFKYLSKQNLKTSALPHVSGGFFSVNLDRVRDRLIELPWVEDVSIRRQWPNALRIRVMEKQPVAFWNKNQLLSSKSALFTPDNIDQNLNLPVLSGPKGLHKEMLKALSRMEAWLADTGLTISRISQDERRSWTLFMESGMELRLGRSYQRQRLQRFVDVYIQKLMNKKRTIKHIDMRYTNGLAVAWKNVSEDLGT